MRDPGSVTYSAAIESAASCDTDDQPSHFAQRALREARRRGFERAKIANAPDDLDAFLVTYRDGPEGREREGHSRHGCFGVRGKRDPQR
jgi:hypothetical protein